MILLGSLLFVVSWRWLFATSALITAIIALILFVYLKGSPSAVGIKVTPAENVEKLRANFLYRVPGVGVGSHRLILAET